MLIYVMRRYIILQEFTHALNKPMVSTLWIEEFSFLHSRREGACWHTFYFLIFHIFSVLANLNIRTQLGSDTLGLQPELYNFHAIYK
jgi:hypothetical protein